MKTFLVFMCFFLASCAADMNAVNRQVGAHQPLAYKQGYADGCDSGYVAAGHPYYKFRKDVSRFTNDELYRQGWEDGCTVCKGEYEAAQRLFD